MKSKSSDKAIKLYSNIINDIAKTITINEKEIQTLKYKLSSISKQSFNFISKLQKNKDKKKIKESIENLREKNKNLRRSQEKYISKLKELKTDNRLSYSTVGSKKSSHSSSKVSINEIIKEYIQDSSDKKLNQLLDEVEVLLKKKLK